MSGAAQSPRLYDLLPEIYRQLDVYTQGDLAELCEVLDSARGNVAQDIAQLYDDWFVETCQDERLPYLAELVGWHDIPQGVAQLRQATALRAEFSRAKGTTPAAERWLQALGGWPVQIGEPDEGPVLIRVSQQSHLQLRNAAPAPVRRGADIVAGAWRVHPLGIDSPLLGPEPSPVSEAKLGAGLLELHWQDSNGDWQLLPPEAMHRADLDQWPPRLPGTAQVLVDPELGRLLVCDPKLRTARLLVSARLPAPLPLDADPALTDQAGLGPDRADEWIAHVHSAIKQQPYNADQPVHYFADLAGALDEFRKQGKSGRIRILDSAAHHLERRPISDRHEICLTQPNKPLRLVIEARAGETPVLRGTMRAHGNEAGLELILRGLAIDGRLVLTGKVTVQCHGCQIHPFAAKLAQRKRLPAIRLRTHRHKAAPVLDLHYCAVGPIHAQAGRITARECVIDGYAQGFEEFEHFAVCGDAALQLNRVTALGMIDCRSITASNSVLAYDLLVRDYAASMLMHCLTGPNPRVHCTNPCEVDFGTPDQLFSSVEFGQRGYVRIARQFADKLHSASSTDGAIGAGSGPDQGIREELVRAALDQVMPLGVEARIRWSG
ncbi:MAG: hypothetical protein K2W91_03040 [Novosphingobium sp.]|nr:hypothetical protein [Novosphingobium sp.]